MGAIRLERVSKSDGRGRKIERGRCGLITPGGPVNL